MIELYISGQSLRIYTPVIAADTLNYLTVQAYFLNDDWEGYTRWVHFRKGNSLGTEVFDLLLDGNNSITEDGIITFTPDKENGIADFLKKHGQQPAFQYATAEGSFTSRLSLGT